MKLYGCMGFKVVKNSNWIMGQPLFTLTLVNTEMIFFNTYDTQDILICNNLKTVLTIHVKYKGNQWHT